jgi:heat shock protein HslJ
MALVAIAPLVVGGCSADDLVREARPDPLAGHSWRAIEVNGQPTVEGSEPTAVFTTTTVSGSTGCNFYDAVYTYVPSTGSIAITKTAMTAVACGEPGTGAVEAAFLDALGRVPSASLDPEGRLLLRGLGGDVLFESMAVPG